MFFFIINFVINNSLSYFIFVEKIGDLNEQIEQLKKHIAETKASASDENQRLRMVIEEKVCHLFENVQYFNIVQYTFTKFSSKLQEQKIFKCIRAKFHLCTFIFMVS